MRQEDAGGSTDPAQQEPIRQAEHLFWHGKFQEALKHLDQLETQEDVSQLAQLQSQLLKCRILAQLDIKKAQDVANQLVKASQDLNQPLIGVDALSVMAEAWLELWKSETCLHLIDQGKTMLASLTSAKSSDLIGREATLLALEGGIYAYTGPIERAIECLQQSLILREEWGKPQEIAHSLYYLGWAYLYQTKYERSVDSLQQRLTIRERLKHPLEIAHSFLCLGWTYSLQGERERALECFQQSLAIYEQLGIQHGMAWAFSFIGLVSIQKGELEYALEVLQNSLAITEQLGISGTIAESNCFMQLGRIYLLKGELEHALESFQKALAFSEEQRYQVGIGWCLNHLGITHMKKGQLEAAFEYMIKGLKVQKELGNDLFIAISLFYLVSISLELGNLKTARRFQQQLKELQDKVVNKFTDLVYHLARALVLKASPRMRDKMHAQILFQQLVGDQALSFELWVLASLHLCELLFFEYKTSEDPEIFREIQAVTSRLLEVAKTQQSHFLLAETYLLQAKLVLLELDVPRARRLFTQAQAIAGNQGLQLLARSISNEQEILLSQLNQWKVLQARKALPDEVSELAGVEAQVVRMIRKRMNEITDNLSKVISNSVEIIEDPSSKKTHPVSLKDRIIRKYPYLKYDAISTVIISCLERKDRLNISQLTEEVRTQRGRASRRIIRERVNNLIHQGIIEELDEGYGRQLRVIPLSDG